MSFHRVSFFFNFLEEFHVKFRTVMPDGHEKDFVGFYIEYFSERKS